MTTRPKRQDIDLLDRLIEMRDAAQLAGIQDDVFRLFEFNGTDSVLFGPGRGEGINVSTLGMRRLQDLGLLHLIDRLDKGFTFDLEDDARDRREEMQVSLGLPSRMGELEATVGRAEAAARAAEAALADQKAEIAAAAGRRADLRSAFARRVGRWVRALTVLALGVLYVIVAAVGYVVSSNVPFALVVGAVGVGVAFALLDWLLHIDGFALAAGVESRAVGRIIRWLESFDPQA